MGTLVNRIGSRLPRGWGDLALQLALFFLAYEAYQVVRGFSDGSEALAVANADRIIHLERSLGAYFEPGLQQAFLVHQWIIDAASWMYLNSHFFVTTIFLAWLYLYRQDNFRFVRNMFLVAMVLALVGYALYPTAPPRFVPGAGFTDTVGAFVPINRQDGFTSVLYNPYAAVPSMHIAFALMVSVPAFALSRSALARAWWSAYPLVVFFVIVVTANHFWFDAAAGAMVACLAAVTAHQLARFGRESWGWPGTFEEPATG